MRLRLTLAYTGTNYHGWQIQDPALELTTVQGLLEKALARLVCAPVRAFGSGRTDAGVHAACQVVHCDVPDTRFHAIHDWRHALNALLPRDIRVLEAGPAAPDFHARYSAVSKTYGYRFWQEQGFVPPWKAAYVWACGPLDTESMRRALPHLAGRHDFASFQNTGSEVADTTREIFSITLEEEPADPLLPPCRPELLLTVRGSGFLKQMVRNIAGLLHDVGQGRLSPECIPECLEKKNRAALPSMTAPPSGLFLAAVEYPGDGGAS